MNDKIVYANVETFNDELTSDVPVLVDFWAEWCGPCKMIAPILDELAEEYDGRLKVVKVNIDESSELAAQYNVRGIPTLLVLKGGLVEATKVGALSKAQLQAFLEAEL